MIKVEIFYIILGLFLGFLVIYAASPPPKVVIKYPNPDTTYVDENGTKYKYFAKEVPCRPNKKFMIIDKKSTDLT
jgi:hypothetical protein